MDTTAGARPENIAKAKEIIAVLKQHPDGIPRRKLARAVGIRGDKLHIFFNGLLRLEPIGYDEKISDLVYWIG